jgi:hypothetical protein
MTTFAMSLPLEPIDIDSRRRQQILETTKFFFEVESHGYLTDWVTEVSEAKHNFPFLINALNPTRTIEWE